VVVGTKNRGRPRLTWMNDVIEWTGLKTYENVKGQRRIETNGGP